MPYSPPVVVSPTPQQFHTQNHKDSYHASSSHSSFHSTQQNEGRPGHRRSYTFALDDPRAGPGAFASLGVLPRRTSHSTNGQGSSSAPNTPGRERRKFHFQADHDDSSSSSDEQQPAQQHRSHDDDDDGPPPPLKLKVQPPGFRLTPATGLGSPRNSPRNSPRTSPNSSSTALNALTVPFPRSSSLSPVSSPVSPIRPPGPARAASQPIILSNGKPLKSSLKSSSSAPHVPSHHLRARSAPSSPAVTSPAEELEELASPLLSPGTPKAVHFPASDKELEDIRLFRRSARPTAVSLSLSLPNGRGGLDDETETETETDREPRIAAWGERENSKGFPFPRVDRPRATSAPSASPLSRPHAREEEETEWRYELVAPGVPREAEEGSMVLLNGLWLEHSSEKDPELTLHGTLLARNAAFEKHLFVRFTLDGWATTSEVGARYLHPYDNGKEPEPGPGWDVFGFSVRLTDYAHTSTSRKGNQGRVRLGRGLAGRTLVLVARFHVPWVKAGCVAPYVWCDSLLAHTLTPATQAGAGTSSSGRAWIGLGQLPGAHMPSGGQGEWWDNNLGRNYEIGFRCVDVVPPVSASTQEGEKKEEETSASVGEVNVIPFPSSESSTVPLPSTSMLASQSPTTPKQNSHSPPKTSPVSSPNQNSLPKARRTTSPPRIAHAQVFAAKLARLRLMNYAAPMTMSLPTTSVSTVNGAVKDEDKSVSLPKKDSSSSDEEDSSDDEEARRDKAAGRARRGSDETPPTSPVRETAEEKETVPTLNSLPPSPPPPTPPANTEKILTSTPNASSTLYNAFVKQWCFVASPVSTPQ